MQVQENRGLASPTGQGEKPLRAIGKGHLAPAPMGKTAMACIFKLAQVDFKDYPGPLHSEHSSSGCWPGLTPLAHIIFA